MKTTTRAQEVLRQLRDEIVEYARNVRRQRGCERLWADAESFQDLCALMQRFVLGELVMTPGHGGPRDEETVEIAEALVHVNGRGFLTMGSQPGLVIPATDTWPEVVQRATVEGVASGSMLTRLRALVSGTRLKIIVGETYRWGWRADYTQAFVATTVGGREATGFGATLSRREIVFIWGGIQEHLLDEIIPMHQVTLYDPEWGPERLLWDRLMTL